MDLVMKTDLQTMCIEDSFLYFLFLFRKAEEPSSGGRLAELAMKVVQKRALRGFLGGP